MNNSSRIVAIVAVAILIGGNMVDAREKGERMNAVPRAITPKSATTSSAPAASGVLPTPAGQTLAPDQQPVLPEVTAAPPEAEAVSTPLSGEQIKWQVISAGGNRGTSTNYVLNATVGQTAAGLSASTSYKVNAGYWQNFGSGCCIATVGNVDCSPLDAVDIGDLTSLINNLFITFAPLCCASEANCDGDPGNNVDIGDLTALINNLFITFAPLPSCQ